MAARLLETVEVYEGDRSARVQIPGTSPAEYDVFAYFKHLEIHEKLSSPWKLKGTLQPGCSPVVDDMLAKKHVLRLTYDDSTFEEYRIQKLERELSGESDPQVEAYRLWADLGKELAHRTLTGGRVDYKIIINARNAQDALDDLMASAPDPFVAGSAGTFATEVVSLHAVGKTHLELLKTLCQELRRVSGKTCEWEAVWNATNSNYEIDLVEEIGGAGTRPIEFGTGKQNNRRAMKLLEDTQDLFTRVVPIGGPDEEPLTIAEATWSCTAATYDSGPNETTLTLADDPIWVAGMPGTSGIEVGNATDGFFTVSSSSTPDQVVVSGDASALNGSAVTFRLTTGDDLTYLADPSAESTLGDVWERLERRTEVAPANNLLGDAGITEDFSSWSGGTPVGVSAVGSATISQTTDDRYVRSAGSAADVSGDTGDGVISDAISLSPDAENPYHSMMATVRVLSGAIRIQLVGSDDIAYPAGEQVDGSGFEFAGLGVGGMEPPSGNAQIKIVAIEDGTQFVIDSWTLTNTAAFYEFTEAMGPEDLWHRGGAVLAEKGGIQPDHFTGTWFDVSYLDGATEDEFVIGGKVQLYDAGGAWDFETRLSELKRQYDGEAYKKRGKLSAAPRDVTDFLTEEGRRQRLPNVPGTRKTVVVPEFEVQISQAGTTAQMDVEITRDPQKRVSVVKFKSGVGEDLDLSDPDDGSWTTDTDPYSHTETIPGWKHNVTIAVAVGWTDEDGNTQYEIRQHTFDGDVIAEVVDGTISFDENGHLDIAVEGDEDTAKMYCRVGGDRSGGVPPDPTSTLNSGSVTGQSSLIETVEPIEMGEEAIVKVVGENAAGELGPVRVFRKRRGDSANRAPDVAATVDQVGSIGKLDLEIKDPMLAIVAEPRFYLKSGAGGFSSSSTAWDRSSGTAGSSTLLTRGEDLPLAEKHIAAIKVEVDYTDEDGTTRTWENSWEFDADEIAEVSNISWSASADGTVVVTAQGDEDTVKMYFTVSVGGTPADPTASTNHGTISGRSGTVDSLISSVVGTDVTVKVVGENSTGELGPVQQYTKKHGIGKVTGKTMKVGYAAMIPSADGGTWNHTAGFATQGAVGGGSDDWYLSIDAIPEGATITEFEARLYRAGTGDTAIARLYRGSSTSGVATQLSSLSHGGTGWSTLSSGTLSETVQDQPYTVEVELEASSSIIDARFLWIKITYTADDLDQTR